MGYQEINPSIWEYKEVGDFIEGVFVRMQDKVGANESKMYSLETSEGIKNIWGSVILDERMALVRIGDKLKITYKGVSKESTKGKNPAKIFKVEVDKGKKKEEHKTDYLN